MSKEQMIHEAAMELMREAGVAVHNDKAIEILEAHGIRVEDQRAYFEEEQVMEWVKKAPEEFKLYARNPKYDMIIGGGVIPAIIVTALGMIISNKFFSDQTWK